MSHWHRPSKRKLIRLFQTKRRSALILSVTVIFGLIGPTLVYFAYAQYRGGDDDQPTGARPAVVTNPIVASQSCLGGLNIALLADTSGSVADKPADFGQMQNALKDFVSSLLPSTRTSFSLTQFGSNATVIQPFTNNVTDLYSGIDRLSNAGSTNWTAGLETAYGTFSNVQNNVPGLLIIATDGDPTEPRNSPGPLYSAMLAANDIKTIGIHILALGVGGSPTVVNLQAISGPKVNSGGVNSDVITSNFSNMGATLQDIAKTSCTPGNGTGGTGIGTGGNGVGVGGNGTGIGTGGTGSGTNGTGKGNTGNGKGLVGSGTGPSTGTTTQPSPTPVPSATQGVQPSPAPTDTPSPNPSPAPTATQTTEPQPNPAPTPMAQGIKIKPPDPTASPFYDGKQYAPGSVTDNFDTSPVRRTSYVWIYASAAAVVVAGVIGFIIWRKRKTSEKPADKSKSSTSGKSRKK